MIANAQRAGQQKPADHEKLSAFPVAERDRRAARCALALAKHLPEASLALVTTRGPRSAREATEALAARARAMISGNGERPRAGAVAIDALTAKLLDARFVIENHDAEACWLFGDDDPNASARTLLGKPTSCVGRSKALDPSLTVP